MKTFLKIFHLENMTFTHRFISYLFNDNVSTPGTFQIEFTDYSSFSLLLGRLCADLPQEKHGKIKTD